MVIDEYAKILTSARPAGVKGTPYTPLPVQADGIPDALRAANRWLTWRLESRNCELAKVPYDSRTGRRATGENFCNGWTTFDQAFAAYQQWGYAGLGFAFDGSDGSVGIDVDDCRHRDGTLEPWASDVVRLVDGFTEVSPSGTGVKIFVRANPIFRNGARGRNFGPVELYAAGRWFATTGHRVPSTEPAIVDRTAEVDALLAACYRVFCPPERPRPAASHRIYTGDLDHVVRRAIAYLRRCDPAISGANGHAQTMRVARAVVHGFDLGPDVGFDLLATHFNPKCRPPWNEKELRHKCEDAHVKPFGLPRGWLRDAERIMGGQR